MLAALAFVLLLATSAQPAPAQDSSSAQASASPCDSLYAATQQLFETHRMPLARAWRQRTPERSRALERLQQRAQETRACYRRGGGPVAEWPTEARHSFLRTYRYEGYALAARQQLEEAFALQDSFLERYAGLPDSTLIHDAYEFRGFLRIKIGDYAQAIDDYLQAAHFAGGFPPPQDLLRKAALNQDAGLLHDRLGNFPAAARLLRRALRQLRAADAGTPRATYLQAMALAKYGSARAEHATSRTLPPDTLRAALAPLQQSLRLLESPALQGALPRSVIAERRAYNLGTQALVYLHLGNLERAEQMLGQERENAAYTDAPGVKANIARLSAELKLRRGAYAEAIPLLESGLRHAATARNRLQRVAILNMLGLARELEQQPAQAASVYRQAIALVEQERSSLRTTGWSAAAFDETDRPYRGLVRALLAGGQTTAAFRALEEQRARHFRDLRMRSRIVNTMVPAQRLRFDSLTTAYNEARLALSGDARLGDLPPARRADLEREATRLESERRDMLDLPAPDDSLSLPAIRRALAERDRVLLSYFIDSPSGVSDRTAQSHVFLLSADTLRAYPIDLSNAQAREYISQASPLLSGRAPSSMLEATQFDLRPLSALYDALIRPVRGALSAGQPLSIVPDGPLYHLPFGLLVQETPGRYRYAEASYLLHRHPVSATLSAALVEPSSAPPREPPPLDFLGFAKGRFDDVAGGPLADSLTSLPGAVQEAEEAARLFARRRVFKNEEATAASFYEYASQSQILHVATHAEVHPRSPLESSIVLSPADSASVVRGEVSRSAHDGLLRFFELQERQLDTPLVTLSACETARGDLRGAEGMQSLQYAIRTTGARSTLSYLWRIDDVSTRALSRTFYRHLIDGQPKDVALQKAQVALLEEASASRASPFFWAAPLLYGNPEPLALEPRVPWFGSWPVAFGAGACLVLLAGTLLWRRRVSLAPADPKP